MTNLKLKIDGKIYEGWHRISVVRSIETLAGRFDLEMSDKDPLITPRGGAVEVLIYDQTIITGFTDTLSPYISAEEHALTISGRDKTGDLVDCSALVEAQEMNGVTLKEIVETIIAPFGLQSVFEINPAEVFKKFSIQQESAFEAIERACRLRGVLASSDVLGRLVVQNYGSRRADEGLVMGKNILSARALYNQQDRFSIYKVYAQQSGSDDIDLEETTQPNGEATDSAVTRYRPKIIMAEGPINSALAQERAEWEAAVAAARSSGLEVTVQGWRQSSGAIWRENLTVPCTIPEMRVNSDMLIKEARYGVDDKGGEKTILILVRPDAYLKQPDLFPETIGEFDE